MQQQHNTAQYTSIFILIAGISASGLLIPRHETLSLGAAYFSAFFGYFWLCKFPLTSSATFTVGLLSRLLLFIGLPMLSDDLYRFIWDGQLINNGMSPFAELPLTIAAKETMPSGLSYELYEQLNSKEYFAIYPPLNQFIFWLSAWIGNDNWLVSANVIRVFLLTGDLVSYVFIRKILKADHRDTQLSNWYWLNPLVILEGVGNLHFELLVVTFMVIGIFFFKQSSYWKSGVGFGLAIATKLLPLIYLPALLLRKDFKSGITTTLIAGILGIISFVPMIDAALIDSMSASLGLYFQKFEFNASIYFLIREIGFWVIGYNIIGTLGPALSMATLFGVLLIAWLGKKRQWRIEEIMLWSLTCYLLLATTVHPWYILPLIMLGVLTNYWFPIIWSLLIFVTYFGYTSTGFELSAGWLVLEYTVVFSVFIIETVQKSNAKNS